MIKINLLGDNTKLDYSNRYILICFILGLVLVSVISFNLYKNTTSEVRQLALESNNLTGKLRALENKTKVVKELEEKKGVLRNKLIAIAKLRKNRVGPVRVLDDLNLSTPRTVWIREIQESEGQVTILGRAIENQDIAFLMTKLLDSDYFESVDLIESRQMYYAKSTGQISGTPSINSVAGTAQQKINVRGEEDRSRAQRILENNIKLKEFTLKSKINYGGLNKKQDQIINLEEQIEIPELAELDDL